MGNGGAKKTNQLLENQRGIQNTYGSDMGARGANEYDFRTGARGNLWDRYSQLADGAPELTGGSAGTADWYGPAADFYRGMMETGGMTDADKTNYRSWTTAPIAGFYQGLKSEMARKNNAIGGYAGYNSQNAKLGRDAARQGFLTAQESESGLLDMINRNKFQGAGGLESSFHKGTPGSAGSRGGVGSQDYYLNKMEGLMEGAEDLPYSQMQGGAYNNAYQGVTNRRDETPGWQKALTGIVPAAASAAVGAFTGGGGSSAAKKAASSAGANSGYGAYGSW
jgi:hypothetical protein